MGIESGPRGPESREGGLETGVGSGAGFTRKDTEDLKRDFVEKYKHLGMFAIAVSNPVAQHNSYVQYGGRILSMEQVRSGYSAELLLALGDQPKKERSKWLNEFLTELDIISRPIRNDLSREPLVIEEPST